MAAREQLPCLTCWGAGPREEPCILRRSHTQQPPNNLLHHAPRTQDEKLPLHYAAAKGAPLDVMKLLLDANSEAVNAADKVPR